MVQTHKLPYSARNKLKFQFIPSKVGIWASFTPIWGTIGKIRQYIPSLHIFIIISLHNSAGVCNTHGSKYI